MEEEKTMRTTKKRSTIGILNKKLRDFESELNALVESNEFVVPESLHQKLAFLKKFLLAEIASDPGHALPRSHHRRLARIVDRIRCLEAILIDPDGLVAGMAANSSITTVQRNGIDDVSGGVETDDIVGGDADSDDGSTCSCTESCLNNDGEENEEEKAEDIEEAELVLYDNPVFQAKSSAMIRPKDDEDVNEDVEDEDEDDEAEEEKVTAPLDGRFWRGVASGAVVTATIMGMVIMVLLGDTFVDRSHFSLAPT